MAQFPTIIPEDERLKLWVKVCQKERELKHLLEECEDFRWREGIGWCRWSPAHIRTKVTNWCRENLQYAYEICMEAIKRLRPSVTPYYIELTVRQIREYCMRDVRHAQKYFEDFCSDLSPTKNEVTRAKRSIEAATEYLINRWIADFHDWARNRHQGSRKPSHHKHRQRKRSVRTKATVEMVAAYDLHTRGLALREIRDALQAKYGSKAPKSATTVARWIAIADADLNPKSRSVRARHGLPVDRRGQVAAD